MPVTLSVTLGDTPQHDAVKAAELILSFYGYQRPVAPPPVSAEEKQVVAGIEVPVFTEPDIITGIDVDSAGLPWDERIHSGSRAKNADGTWRQKRGVNDADYVKRIEAELRQRVTPALTAHEAVEVLGAPPAVEAPIPVPPPFVPSAVPSAPPASTIPTAPVSDGVAPIASHGEQVTFPSFMQRATQTMASDPTFVERYNSVLKANGIENTMMLSQRPDLVPVLYAELFQ